MLVKAGAVLAKPDDYIDDTSSGRIKQKMILWNK